MCLGRELFVARAVIGQKLPLMRVRIEGLSRFSHNRLGELNQAPAAILDAVVWNVGDAQQ